MIYISRWLESMPSRGKYESLGILSYRERFDRCAPCKIQTRLLESRYALNPYPCQRATISSKQTTNLDMLAFKLGYGFIQILTSGVTHHWNDWTTRTEIKAAKETIEKNNVAFLFLNEISKLWTTTFGPRNLYLVIWLILSTWTTDQKTKPSSLCFSFGHWGCKLVCKVIDY